MNKRKNTHEGQVFTRFSNLLIPITLICEFHPRVTFWIIKIEIYGVKRLYLTGSQGFVYDFEQLNADKYRLRGKTLTAEGARTSLFVPELNRLFVAVPHRGKQSAEIRVYQL